jgi:hypothetical protein
MFKENDKVLMLKNDGWATKGWIGVIPPQKLTPRYGGIRVCWSNGEELRHSKKDLRILNKNDDPNIAFYLSKLNRSGGK